jgi:hypothetical protein
VVAARHKQSHDLGSWLQIRSSVFPEPPGVPSLASLCGSLKNQGASPHPSLADRSSARSPRLQAFALPRVTGRGAGFIVPFLITDSHLLRAISV